MSEEIPGESGDETLHGHGIENASGFTQPVANQEHRILARLAQRKEWVIPQRVFGSGPEVLTVIAEDESAEPRERIAAMRTLVMMQNANTGQGALDVRINQQIAIEVAPEAPSDVNLDVQPAWAEIVSTDNLGSTVDVLESLGLMARYVDQVRESAPPLPSNGNGKH